MTSQNLPEGDHIFFPAGGRPGGKENMERDSIRDEKITAFFRSETSWLTKKK